MIQGKEHKPITHFEAVAIGVSAGGIRALEMILGGIGGDFSLSIIIVQHMSAGSDDFLARHLNEKSALPVKQADEKEVIRRGNVYLAPPDYHLLVEEDKTLSLSVDEKINYARPSIDLLFETAAFAYGPALVGLVLTGASGDGSRGLKTIKAAGGLTVVQDPETAEAPVMPREAIRALAVDHVLPLEGIARFLIALPAKSGRGRS